LSVEGEEVAHVAASQTSTPLLQGDEDIESPWLAAVLKRQGLFPSLRIGKARGFMVGYLYLALTAARVKI
jgi:hypothetical protein